MPQPYSDFVERVLLFEDTLQRPLPDGPQDIEMILRIRAASDADLIGSAWLEDRSLIPLLRAGLFYFHDAVEESCRHAELPRGPLADYWRQMIYRRLGEFELARHYGRSAGELPPFQLMLRLVKDDCPAMARQANWDAYLVNSLTEQFRFGESDLLPQLRRLQRVEFTHLYRYTWKLAVGGQ